MEAENQKRDLLLWVREVEVGAQPKLELESRARQKPWFGIQEEHLGLKRSSLDGQRWTKIKTSMESGRHQDDGG